VHGNVGDQVNSFIVNVNDNQAVGVMELLKYEKGWLLEFETN
jgi:hypothetical protein